MADFLLELLSEEIPARMQDKARDDLRWAFETEIRVEGSLHQGTVRTYSTPRRLVLIAESLADQTEAEAEEIKGPRASAPEQAIEGFLRKNGATRDQLDERPDEKGVPTLYLSRQKPSRSTKDVLATIIPRIVTNFPWPKSMRWGAASVSTESQRWVRPLHNIVALLGEEIVAFEIAGVKSGAATVGHRFHHPGPITIGGAHDYAEKLRACHVVLDPEERRRIIAEGAAKAAADAGLTLIEDEGLLAENAGLTEWPVPLLGGFDPAFLDVPREVIQLTMRTNQKYFALTDGERALAPHFVCVANIEATDGGAAIVEGNRKVLAARLSDAKFFWEHDLKVPLAQQAEKLGQIVFHEKLGTVADKVERVARLARWLVEEGIVKPEETLSPGGRGQGEGVLSQRESSAAEPPLPNPLPSGEREELADLAETAARLCKADLVTGLVGEFPELQGVIGGHLARAQGEDPQIAAAIRDHYKPVGQGDEVPTAPVTVAVSLADKLDTLVSFFAAGLEPTGSKDPFALRRSAIGGLAMLVRANARHQAPALLRAFYEPASWSVKLAHIARRTSMTPAQRTDILRRLSAAEKSREIRFRRSGDTDIAEIFVDGGILFGSILSDEASGGVELLDPEALVDRLLPFLIDRLKVQQREAGVRHDLIDAVFALGGEDDLVRLLARVKALQAFVETAEGRDLLAGYKRAANILKKEGWPPSPSPQGGEGRGEGAPASEDSPEGRTPSPHPLSAGDGEQDKNKTLPYPPEKEEDALIAALDSAEPRARAAVAAEDFEGAMAALASLRAPVDSFFDKVTVNDPDPARRSARLDLLARMRDAVHRVADFSRIEG